MLGLGLRRGAGQFQQPRQTQYIVHVASSSSRLRLRLGLRGGGGGI